MADQEATRPYRFTGDGKKVRHNVIDTDGKGRRAVEKGEIVHLTARQFKAFRDRFEPVGGVDSAADSSRPPSPTIEEYTAAGYPAHTYPPYGYEVVESPGWTAEKERRAAEAKAASQTGTDSTATQVPPPQTVTTGVNEEKTDAAPATTAKVTRK